MTISNWQNAIICPCDKAKPPGWRPRGFLFRLMLSAITAQPFADIIGGDTCCDGNQKRD